MKRSRFLSLVLRHHPARIGLTLDPNGWADVDALLDALAAHGRPMSRAQLDRVVAENDKQRFAFDAAGTRIRASQGHSVAVDLGYADARPPDRLFHGTHPGALAAIRREGLRPMQRHDVHLSADRETAARVGARRGRAVVLGVDAARMTADGHRFRLSDNRVWLTAAVPPQYLSGWSG
ncbi:RNA 2'-phosphotransferase [Streptacidiphilus sp. 4-A2]|nr:RNA 2'-phosphotransferase [Streptacidiphilus sp. 4-A2]